MPLLEMPPTMMKNKLVLVDIRMQGVHIAIGKSFAGIPNPMVFYMPIGIE